MCFIVFMQVIFFIFPRLLVAGDSAGGNLTASLTLKTIQVVRLNLLELQFDIWLGVFPRCNFPSISEIQICPSMGCLDFAKLGWNRFETTNLMKIFTFLKAHPAEYFHLKLVRSKYKTWMPRIIQDPSKKERWKALISCFLWRKYIFLFAQSDVVSLRWESAAQTGWCSAMQRFLFSVFTSSFSLLSSSSSSTMFSSSPSFCFPFCFNRVVEMDSSFLSLVQAVIVVDLSYSINIFS